MPPEGLAQEDSSVLEAVRAAVDSAKDRVVRDVRVHLYADSPEGVRASMNRESALERAESIARGKTVSAALRLHLRSKRGLFASLASAIVDAGGSLGMTDFVRAERGKKVSDVTVLAPDRAHLERIVTAVDGVDGVDVERVTPL